MYPVRRLEYPLAGSKLWSVPSPVILYKTTKVSKLSEIHSLNYYLLYGDSVKNGCRVMATRLQIN